MTHKFLLVTLAVIVTVCNSFAQKPLSEDERYKLAADYSRRNRGVSVLVMKGDKIVFEDYQNGNTVESCE